MISMATESQTLLKTQPEQIGETQDTDGGGMMDGDECPQEFWFTNCQNSPFDPWDPSDDIMQNDIILGKQH